MYFGVLCSKCESPILFGVDPSDGNCPMNRTVILRLTCADNTCGWQDDYSEAPVSRFRKGTEGAEVVELRESE